MTNPTAVLRAEHRSILKIVDVLESLLSVDSGSLDLDLIAGCVQFFRLFADACHHGKEEDLLFPALESQGLPRHEGPLAVMLHEHRLGRDYVAAMAASLDGARAGTTGATTRLVAAGRAYIDLIRGHILKEDHVLFNMADEMVVGAACTRLCADYDATADRCFGGCSKADLERLADEILETAPIR